MMTKEEIGVFAHLAEAYRILRREYWHDIHKEEPPKNDLQIRVDAVLQSAILSQADTDPPGAAFLTDDVLPNLRRFLSEARVQADDDGRRAA